MKQIITFLILTLSLTSCFHKKAIVGKVKGKKFGQVYKSKDNEFRYQMAEQYFATKKYEQAAQLFEDLFPYIKGTDKYEDMYYKSAFCYYNLKDYLNAENLFKNFVETFPNSKKAEECDYLRAFCYYKQSPKAELDQTPTMKAMALMQAFINTHPTSIKNKEANEIIDLCREKLELKDFKSAELYYNLGYFKASSLAFESVAENFPDSKKADEYKYFAIKSLYSYADLSYEEKQVERFGKVIAECNEFIERFADSKLINEVKKIKDQTNNNLKKIQNEQVKKTN
jgi:outer membrane protein assembly factor BamD